MKRFQGGSGAADYAIGVYGGIGQQHAVDGNLIGMSANACSNLQSGGKQQQQAGNVLTDIAVPAVLVSANQLYKRQQFPMNFVKSRKFRKSRKSRKYGRRRRR
jgi:hypothetical protein